MKRYTVGFVFDSTMENVLLIHKTHPEWQKGKINGPGGKLEENETPHACVAREIQEETTLSIPPEKWTLVAEIENDQRVVQFFGAIHHGKKEDARTSTEEKAEWFATHALPSNVIPNLTWLIPLCKDHMLNQKMNVVKIRSED